MRLLAAGVNVARTASDLVRYHGKLMIVDRRELFLLAFNFTNLDIERSRSFGIITTNARLVHEAQRLFEADTQRRAFEPERSNLVVSPVNARRQLSAFIRGARKELLIYDPTISDPAMIRLLEERSEAGVDVRIIGRLTRRRPNLEIRKLAHIRLHVRAIIRDGKQAFIGSQSLREIELDGRREVGIVFRDRRAVSRLTKIFQDDWDLAGRYKLQREKQESEPAVKVAKRVAKQVTKDLLPVAPMVETIVKDVAGASASVELDTEEVEASVREAVKEAVKEVVKDMVESAVEQEDARSADLTKVVKNGRAH
jgi:phosphatidylserine/phosphatidylglycerophosphate/cardiolipin synthase-like enzyme